ncbi:MAG TPA: SpoIIE family protein phosphatase [Phycisphaerales bacterium]|nr:SpoIIE family protein phosphatase [Phycisphaerales bacterium]
MTEISATGANIDTLTLKSISGPESKSLPMIPPGPLTIGRRTTHNLFLPDPASRDHAVLTCERAEAGYRWFITDTNSKHGTRLNGQSLPPGTRFPLRAGDLIEIVPWTFQVTDPAAARTDTSMVNTLDDFSSAASSIGPISSAIPSAAHQQLGLVLKCAKRIHEANDEDTLAEAILDALVTGTGFENAAVLRPMDSDGRVSILRHRGAIMRGNSARMSRSLIESASRGHPVRLSADQSQANQGMSIMELRIDEALCVPLVLGGTVAGFLYMDNRRQDGLSKPIANDAAEFALGIGQIAAMALANLKRLDLERRYASVEAEVKAAAEAQRWVLPPRTGRVGSVNYIGESRPGRTVSGDFFDIIPLRDSRLAVTLGDVSGKGIAASILMTTAQGFLRAALNEHGDPARAVMDLNEFLEPRCRSSNFITLWIGVIDPAQGQVTYVDAGHGYSLLLTRGGGHARLNEAGGVPVGIQVHEPYLAATAPMAAHDRLLVVSDGVIEQTGSGVESGWEQQFGIDGVLEAMAEMQGDDVQVLFEALVRHAGTNALADDATAVLLSIGANQ